jgi:AcrR family transcriptional regulator
MPRNSARAAEETRARILDEATQQLSVYGAEGTSLAAIAASLEMSKAGVVGPFGSREALLREAFATAAEIFRAQVIAPALVAEPSVGSTRVAVLIDAWVQYLAHSPFRGGCVLVSASADLDGHPNPLRSTVATTIRDWRTFLGSIVDEARSTTGLTTDTDVVVDQLVGLAMSLNQSVQLLSDESAPQRVRRAMRAAIGISA